MQQCLQFVVEQGSAARNTLNMLNDFYFKVFHPVQHYTLQVRKCVLSKTGIIKVCESFGKDDIYF